MTPQLLQTICGSLLILSVCGSPFQRWPIELTSGGYNNILIAINERVDEIYKTEILNKIELYIGDFSRAMYHATRNKLYIRNVTVLVPQSWSGSYTAAGKEAFQYANILIDEANPATGDTPYVARSLPECGKPGDYMHLTPEYLKQGFRDDYGEPGNVLLHEWAHLRWGLGDEYPHKERGESSFYVGVQGNFGSSNSTPVAEVKCSHGVTGKRHSIDGNTTIIGSTGCNIDQTTGLPKDTCFYVPAKTGQAARASVMYDQSIDSVNEFCDDVEDRNVKHNADAPNEQNIICEGKSAWAVFNEHSDFQGQGLEIDETELIPDFTIIQRKLSSRIVLVLDTSGSMDSTDSGATASRIERLASDATQYINNVISDGKYVGIVSFASYATVVKPLTIIDNARSELTDSVHFDASGSTCIGCGILEAIEVLETMGSAAGGNIIIISDGHNTAQPDKLTEAAEAIQTKQIYLGNPKITTTSSLNITFYIDRSIGRNTTISFTYPSTVSSNDTHLTLYSPGGSVMSSGQSSNELARIITIDISGIAQVGLWTLVIENKAGFDIDSQILVLSKQSVMNESPITATAFVSNDFVDHSDAASLSIKIVAEVKKGYSPVIGATVKALVRTTGSVDATELTLRDSGIGADVNKNDGYYTGKFIGFSNGGIYSVKIQVSNADGSAGVFTGGSLGAYRHPDINDTSSFVSNVTTEAVGEFDRSTSGGFFTVENYSSDDMFPPAKISDLSLRSMNYKNSTIELLWTAMGEDFDQNGPASSYSLRYCETSKQLRDLFNTCTEITNADLISGDLSTPAEPYVQETVTVRLPAEQSNTTYYFGVKVVDDDGQWSPLSNVVSAGIYYIPPYIEPTTEGIKTTTQEIPMETTTVQTESTLPESTVEETLSTSPATTTSYRTTDHESSVTTTHGHTTESDTTTLGVAKSGLTRKDVTIIGSSAGALLLVVIVTVCVTAYCFKLSKKQRPLYATDFSDVERMYPSNTSDLSRGLKIPRPGVVGLNHGHAMYDSMSDRGMDRGYGNNGFAPHGNRLPRRY